LPRNIYVCANSYPESLDCYRRNGGGNQGGDLHFFSIGHGINKWAVGGPGGQVGVAGGLGDRRQKTAD